MTFERAYDDAMPTETITIGQFELTSIPVQPESLRPTPQFFPSADLTALETVRAELPAMFGSSVDELRFGQSLCVLRDSSGVTMVDAGLPATPEGWPLMSGLTELGIAPDQVTRVFITHRDADHIGGLVDISGAITFSKAQHFIGSLEYTHFKQDERMREWFTKCLAPLEQAGLLTVIEAQPLEGIAAAPEFAPGLKAVATPGHRSGATSLLASNAALLTADVLHAAFQVTHPEVSIMFDADSTLAALTRAAVMKAAAAHGWVLHVPHLPPFGLGRVMRDAAGRSSWQQV